MALLDTGVVLGLFLSSNKGDIILIILVEVFFPVFLQAIDAALRFQRPASLCPKPWSMSIAHVMVYSVHSGHNTANIYKHLLKIWPESFSSPQGSLQRFALSSTCPGQLWDSPHVSSFNPTLYISPPPPNAKVQHGPTIPNPT